MFGMLDVPARKKKKS